MAKIKNKKRFKFTKGSIIGFIVGLVLIAAGFLAYNYFFSCSGKLFPPTNSGGLWNCGWSDNNIWSDPNQCKNFMSCCQKNSRGVDYWRCRSEAQKCTGECIASKCDVKARNCSMNCQYRGADCRIKCDTDYDKCKQSCSYE